jgi:hypothetical protein
MDAIESYQIVVKGHSINIQNYSIKESYVTNLASTDAVQTTNIFSKARQTEVWNHKDTVRTGTLVNFEDIVKDDGTELADWSAGSLFTLEIPLKIDIRRILLLSNMKFLPKFVSNFELSVKFSPASLVYAPLLITDVFQSVFNQSKIQIIGKSPTMTSCFVPMSKNFFM